MLDLEMFEMADKSVRYTPEFKRQMVDLVRSGRTPASLSKEFGPTAWSIALWVKRARRDDGTGDGGADDRRARGAVATAAREPQVEGRTGDSFKSRGLVRNRERDLEALFGFVKVNQATHPVGVMCRLLQISRSGFYVWLDRPMSARARADLSLTGKIEAIHRGSKEVYGAPNIHAELADDYGIRVGRKRVARLMRAAGLRGATLRRFVVTTQPDLQAPRPVDLVDRQFYIDGPDRLWVADITYIPTWSGFLYLAMVLDVYSRRAVGWSMETHLRTELILAALNMALTQRRPSEVIHHSDRGCQGWIQMVVATLQ
jgi:transposase-like protein